MAELLIDRLRQVEQEILDVIHDICETNGLRYSLAYGTLLGAVRHKGFIPWDDDIDIMMPRDDYNKLISIWKEQAPEQYILQDCYTYPDCTNNFVKIRKDHTTFLQVERERSKSYHKGIFVDVFPMDRVAPTWLSRKYQQIMCKLDLLYNRGYRSGKKGISGLVERILLSADSRNYSKIQRWAESRATKWNLFETQPFFCFCRLQDVTRYYRSDLFNKTIKIEFNGKQYCSVENYDEFLKDRYGDYMQLPPVEERVWGHHPILIDFTRNYDEIDC